MLVGWPSAGFWTYGTVKCIILRLINPTFKQTTCALESQVLPDVADMLGEKTNLLSWLLTRIQPKAFDSNKQYASEILAVLVQVTDNAVGVVNGMCMPIVSL